MLRSWTTRLGLRAPSALYTPQQQLMPTSLSVSKTFVRGKRTKRRALAPGAQRVINMLSVFSAHKKQPRRIKLCLEDLIRHNMVQKAWQIFIRDKKIARTDALRQQYDKIQEACEELETVDKYLASEATKREKGKRFPLELRVPTESPPNEVWTENWTPNDPHTARK